MESQRCEMRDGLLLFFKKHHKKNYQPVFLSSLPLMRKNAIVRCHQVASGLWWPSRRRTLSKAQSLKKLLQTLCLLSFGLPLFLLPSTFPSIIFLSIASISAFLFLFLLGPRVQPWFGLEPTYSSFWQSRPPARHSSCTTFWTNNSFSSPLSSLSRVHIWT